MIFIDTIDKDKIDSVLDLKIYSDNIEDAYKKYNNGILDIFDHQLSEDETDSSFIGSFVDYNLRYENRYIEIIKDFYKLNSYKPVIIEAHIADLENINILRILDTLDYKDKLIFIDLIRFNKYNSNMFSIETQDLLDLFVRLATRELLFPIFHFTKIGLTIVGSWDLSFPVFFSNTDHIENFIKVARNNKLFFRNLEYIYH